MKVLIGGDFYPGDWSSKTKCESELFWQEIVNVTASYDYTLLNLESPITNSDSAEDKTGPNLKSYLPDGFFALGNVHAVTLANNHVMDFGIAGITDTISYCDTNQVKYVGAGKGDSAKKPLILKKGNNSLAIINIAENEWLEVDEYKAYGMDPVDNARLIRETKTMAKHTLVIVHCGSEHYHLPSPRTKRFLRFLIEQGADAIVCHHAHCASGYELYNSKPIFYGIGNFYFPYNDPFPGWRKGLLVGIEFDHDDISFDLIPICHDEVKISLNPHSDSYIDEIKKLNEIISNDSQLEEKWYDWCCDKVDEYLTYVNVGNTFLRKVILKLGLYGVIKNKNLIRRQQNYIRCESHKDILLFAMKKSREK